MRGQRHWQVSVTAELQQKCKWAFEISNIPYCLWPRLWKRIHWLCYTSGNHQFYACSFQSLPIYSPTVAEVLSFKSRLTPQQRLSPLRAPADLQLPLMDDALGNRSCTMSPGCHTSWINKTTLHGGHRHSDKLYAVTYYLIPGAAASSLPPSGQTRFKRLYFLAVGVFVCECTSVNMNTNAKCTHALNGWAHPLV